MLPNVSEDIARVISALEKRIERLERRDQIVSANSAADNAGIGTNDPQRRLHIVGTDGPVGAFPTALGGKDFLVVENNDNVNIALIANTNNSSAVKFFKDGGAGPEGQVEYIHTSDELRFYTSTSLRWFIDSAGNLIPIGAGVLNIGSAAAYINVLNYKVLTDRGCLGWYDNGVELANSKKVGAVKALKAIQQHPTLLTPCGMPRLDYATMPKDVYTPAPIAEEDIYEEEKILDDDDPVTGEPRYEMTKTLRTKKGEKIGDDGAELSSLVSIMLAALKELDIRLSQVER